MQLLVLLSVIFGCWAEKNMIWRLVYLDTFTVTKSFYVGSEIHCALLASKLNWVRLYRYENKLCQMSNEVKLPSNFEKKLLCKTNLTPQDELCPETYQKTSKGCFKFSSSTVTWNDARKECLTIGAILASPVNDLSAIEEIAMLQGMPTEAWIGANRGAVTEPFTIYSASGNLALPTDSDVWDGIDPDGSLSNPQLCVRMRKPEKKLRDTPCSQLHHYICEVPAIPIS